MHLLSCDIAELSVSFKARDLRLGPKNRNNLCAYFSNNFCAQIGKNVFKYGYHGYKNIDMLYLSNGAR